MPLALVLVLTVIVAAVAAAFTVPAIRAIAVPLRLLDYPDGDRHHHAQPVPRLGGVAVVVGLLAALWFNTIVTGNSGAAPWSTPLNRALAFSSGILFLIGLLDDLRGVSPVFKLIGQTVAGVVLVTFGFRIDVISIIPGYTWSLGPAAIPVTLLWLVGVSNAFNLVDGLDGLAGGVGVIAVAAIAAAGMALGNAVTPLQALALGGALLGFLRHNWSPARIFLGDSGSLVVGFLLAFLAVQGSTNRVGVVYALIPIFALSYLLLDTGIAMLRRWLRGAPLSRADGRHIHHQLLALGLTPRRAAALIYAQAVFVAGLGLSVTFVPPEMTFVIAVVGLSILVAILVYGLRWLDYHEFLEAGASLASAMRKARSTVQDRILARDVCAMLRDAHTRERVNEIVRSHATAFRFVHMDLLYEDDAATGKTVRAPDHIGSQTWLLEYPIPLAQPDSAGGPVPDAVLAIWSAVGSEGRPAHPYRVAEILAPAIAQALMSAPLPEGAEATHETRVRGRASGAMYARRRVSSEHRRISDILPKP